MSGDVVIAFEPPAPLLSMNDRTHHAKRAPIVAEWRKAAYWHACEQLPPSPSGRRLEGKQRVKVGLPVPDRRRRDPSNFHATVKPIVDGLTDANLWPDDDADHVTVEEPALLVGQKLVVVRLTPIPEEG